ncbi:unnamed protein product [Rhodiola kirilowii]
MSRGSQHNMPHLNRPSSTTVHHTANSREDTTVRASTSSEGRTKIRQARISKALASHWRIW